MTAAPSELKQIKTSELRTRSVQSDKGTKNSKEGMEGAAGGCGNSHTGSSGAPECPGSPGCVRGAPRSPAAHRNFGSDRARGKFPQLPKGCENAQKMLGVGEENPQRQNAKHGWAFPWLRRGESGAGASGTAGERCGSVGRFTGKKGRHSFPAGATALRQRGQRAGGGQSAPTAAGRGSPPGARCAREGSGMPGTLRPGRGAPTAAR